MDLDIVTQGNSTEGALEATKEAVTMILGDELGKGSPPMEGRQRAPQRYWNQLSQVMRSGMTSETREDRLALRSEPQAMATKLRFICEGKKLVDISPMWRLYLT